MRNIFLIIAFATLTNQLFSVISSDVFTTEPKEATLHFSDDTTAVINTSLKRSGMEGIRSRLLDKKCEFFYFSNNPETAIDIIKEIAALDEFGPRIVFLITLLEMYPQQILQVMQEIGVKFEESVPLILALDKSGLKKEAFSAGMKAGLSSDNLMNIVKPQESWPPLEEPKNVYVDTMVCRFWTKGDVSYINKLLDIFDLTSEDVSSSFNLEELKQRARECLEGLVFRHEKVYQHFLKEYVCRSGESKRFLDETKEKYKAFVATKLLPEGLLGDVWISDKRTITEAQAVMPLMLCPERKVISAVPNSQEVQKIKILPLFSHFKLDQDFNGYVTYDIDVYDPEGNKVCSFNGKKGLKGKISSRYLVHAAEDAIEINFQFVKKHEEKLTGNNSYIEAKAGTYKIQGIIKDHVGDNEIKIIRTIEIL